MNLRKQSGAKAVLAIQGKDDQSQIVVDVKRETKDARRKTRDERRKTKDARRMTNLRLSYTVLYYLDPVSGVISSPFR